MPKRLHFPGFIHFFLFHYFSFLIPEQVLCFCRSSFVTIYNVCVLESFFTREGNPMLIVGFKFSLT